MFLSSSNRKYPPFPLFSYFYVVVCLRCLLHHILSLIVYKFRENREFVFISIVLFRMSANSRIRFGLQIVFVCLYITPSHYHHCANFIWIHWTYKMPVRCNLSSVWVRLSIFSQLSIIQYVGLCVFSFPISFVMIEIIYIYTLSYYHLIGSMNYYPLFRVRSWNNGMSFYIIMPVLVKVMTWCCQAPGHYLNQSCQSSMTQSCVTMSHHQLMTIQVTLVADTHTHRKCHYVWIPKDHRQPSVKSYVGPKFCIWCLRYQTCIFFIIVVCI